ncbi:MAG: HD domain-containing protein [Oscillospiraceae bacterium]
MSLITYKDVANNAEIKIYIQRADESLIRMGYTEHSLAHVVRSATVAHNILSEMGYDERTCELARIAGYMHDIGNVVNRVDHAQSGAVMAFRILDKMGMGADELSLIITAIGNHDEHTAFPVSALAAALILADKSDVRRSRVRNKDIATFDIHDRVNYAVERSALAIDKENKIFTLLITIDTGMCQVSDYFEIFLERMLLCRRAAQFFDCKFALNINDTRLM